ncbi:hypothetical protein AWJ20_65 [Sugiyamaella lignohabitans]|uniref:C2H2-type domain-containing protein n=1 Tax=Sugiyamaella lignohabitans TaxID=796027 RepID=A0A161HGE5_9ASCO|nr:uncharacterized protein AWJ20_65 [Sugiyamaella lignohabitans]ANB11841.1 hypothetical protein AWJ20_65 [Sugiyamaella lignohabitans]
MIRRQSIPLSLLTNNPVSSILNNGMSSENRDGTAGTPAAVGGSGASRINSILNPKPEYQTSALRYRTSPSQAISGVHATARVQHTPSGGLHGSEFSSPTSSSDLTDSAESEEDSGSFNRGLNRASTAGTVSSLTTHGTNGTNTANRTNMMNRMNSMNNSTLSSRSSSSSNSSGISISSITNNNNSTSTSLSTAPAPRPTRAKREEQPGSGAEPQPPEAHTPHPDPLSTRAPSASPPAGKPAGSHRRKSSVFNGNSETGLANYIKVPLKKRTRDQVDDGAGNDDDTESLEYQYQCLDCLDRFSSTSELRQHKKNLHHIQTYKCRKCGELFRSIADRQTHKNNKHFDTITCTIEGDNFREFKQGSTVSSNRNGAGYFSCPVDYCTFLTRIPGYWYDHVHHVEHHGENPQKRKKRASMAP